MSVYGPSPTKRARRTRAELQALDTALAAIAAEIEPATVRQVFYKEVVRGGLALPTDIAEAAHMPFGSVKNDLTRLRRTESLEDTGQRHSQTRAEEGRPAPGGAAPCLHDTVGDYAVTPMGGSGKVPGAPSRRRLTADEAAKIQRVILQGMSPKLVRLQVLVEEAGDPR